MLPWVDTDTSLMPDEAEEVLYGFVGGTAVKFWRSRVDAGVGPDDNPAVVE